MIFKNGEIDYLKVTDPDADLEKLKQDHWNNLDCPLYRAQHVLRLKKIKEQFAFEEEVKNLVKKTDENITNQMIHIRRNRS